MKIAVIGAGIVGVCSAYELARQGHAVTVFERHGSVGEETSFANAGVVAPSYVTPWAAPGMPWKVLQHLLGRHAPVRLGWPSGADLRWMASWLKACRSANYMTNRERMQRLAFYSREQLHNTVARERLEFDRSEGYMVLLRSAKDLDLAQKNLDFLRDAGVTHKLLDPPQALAIEPALNPETPLHAAIHLPQDEVGNCRQFALLIKQQAEDMGVRFAFNTTLLPLSRHQPLSLQVKGSRTELPFDAVVVSAGVASLPLVQPLGLHLPMIAVHGYSVTAAIRNHLDAPRSGLMDERYKVSISRLGQRIRVAGSAEIGGSTQRHHPGALRTLYKVLSDWFPGGAKISDSLQIWKGARPMMPDGPPILGASGIPGVWLNVGHGSSGWALANGSAKVLCDLISGRQPDIDISGLGIDRLRR
ncbi:MAG: FAD-dependent oxidoreductase [Betaproteobacteria bacterium]|jgi:D-amino-acid dehydrogenase|nr:FAD-dependent oxidoreductase [Betaproteobacteria bacterium]